MCLKEFGMQKKGIFKKVLEGASTKGVFNPHVGFNTQLCAHKKGCCHHGYNGKLL
jgi:hypothetical protein